MRQIPFGAPLIGDEERSAVADVLSQPILTHGPRVQKFEAAFAEFTGAPHAIATASCMASLHLAYLAIDLEPGDEVIVPAQTHVAMAHAVRACGAEPVFVDCERQTGNVDIDAIPSLLSDRTRAISVIHYLGLPVEMNEILALAAERELYVVEDCAIALGARCGGRHVGLHGDIGCFSFYPVKHITTGEGGMVITRRDEIAERVSKQRAFGIDRSIVSERRHSGEYEIDALGLNYRLGEIPAAIGIEQMRKLPGFLEARRENFRSLFAALSEIDGFDPIPSDDSDDRAASHYCLVARLDEDLAPRRAELIEALKARGVGTSVYYPRPLPDTAYYSASTAGSGRFPNAREISYASLAFPVGPHLAPGDVERVAECAAAAARQVKAEVEVTA